MGALLSFLSERAKTAPTEAQYRAERLDDFRAYLSDFFIAWSFCARQEIEAGEVWENSAVERMNHMGRL